MQGPWPFYAVVKPLWSVIASHSLPALPFFLKIHRFQSLKNNILFWCRSALAGFSQGATSCRGDQRILKNCKPRLFGSVHMDSCENVIVLHVLTRISVSTDFPLNFCTFAADFLWIIKWKFSFANEKGTGALVEESYTLTYCVCLFTKNEQTSSATKELDWDPSRGKIPRLG